MEARYRVITSLNCIANPSVPFSRIDELRTLINANDNSIRKIAYVNLLIRQFEALNEVCSSSLQADLF